MRRESGRMLLRLGVSGEPGDEWGVRRESGRMLPSFSSLVLFPGQYKMVLYTFKIPRILDSTVLCLWFVTSS